MRDLDRPGCFRLAAVSGLCALGLATGCASTTDPAAVLQPGIARSAAVPFEGRLHRVDARWSLSYVESGNLVFGPWQAEKLPAGLDDALAEVPALEGQRGWYPDDAALVRRLADDNPGWHAFASAMETIKKEQAGSVADYNQRLAGVVADYQELQQIAADTELPETPDFRGQAEQAVSNESRAIKQRLADATRIRWVDETGEGLLDDIDPEPPEHPARIQVSYQGDWPDFTRPASPEDMLDWLPARNLSQLENRASQARNRIENLARTHARARKENQRKLEAFRQQLEPADFRVSPEGRTVEPTGYQASVEPSEVERTNGAFAWSGPARVKVQAINLGAWFRLMGVMPPGATLRAGPDENAQTIRRVSGPEIGYPVETRGDWTRLFGEDDRPLGWVPADKLARPQKVIDAQVQRALGDG